MCKLGRARLCEGEAVLWILHKRDLDADGVIESGL
jgi:hypothetical protein